MPPTKLAVVAHLRVVNNNEREDTSKSPLRKIATQTGSKICCLLVKKKPSTAFLMPNFTVLEVEGAAER